MEVHNYPPDQRRCRVSKVTRLFAPSRPWRPRRPDSGGPIRKLIPSNGLFVRDEWQPVSPVATPSTTSAAMASSSTPGLLLVLFPRFRFMTSSSTRSFIFISFFLIFLPSRRGHPITRRSSRRDSIRRLLPRLSLFRRHSNHAAVGQPAATRQNVVTERFFRPRFA